MIKNVENASIENDKNIDIENTNMVNQEISNVETASSEDSQTQDVLIEYIKQTSEKINLLDFDIEFYLFYVSNEMKKILETINNKDKKTIYWYLERISEDSKKRFLSNCYMQYAYLYEAFQKLKEMLPTPLPTSINIENENVDIQELESLLNLIQKNLKISQELCKKENEARKQLIEKLRVLKTQALETES